MPIKPKSFQDFLKEDPSLTRKYTPEEIEARKHIPADTEGVTIEEAYGSYKRVLHDGNIAGD